MVTWIYLQMKATVQQKTGLPTQLCRAGCQPLLQQLRGARWLSGTFSRVQIFEHFTDCVSWFISCTLTNWQRAPAEPENCLCIVQKTFITHARSTFFFSTWVAASILSQGLSVMQQLEPNLGWGKKPFSRFLLQSTAPSVPPSMQSSVWGTASTPPFHHLYSLQGSSLDKKIAAHLIFKLNLHFISIEQL